MRLPLLVDAVVQVVEAQAAPGAVSRLEHLAPAQLGAEAEEAALANHHEVRGGIGDGHGVLEGGGAEGDRLTGRVAIDDVRKAVHRERHHLARAETLRGGTRIGGILVTLAARIRVRSNPANASEERGRRLPGPTGVPRHHESVRTTRKGSGALPLTRAPLTRRVPLVVNNRRCSPLFQRKNRSNPRWRDWRVWRAEVRSEAKKSIKKA